MPLAIDGDESEFIAIRDSQRRWTESESSVSSQAPLEIGSGSRKPSPTILFCSLLVVLIASTQIYMYRRRVH